MTGGAPGALGAVTTGAAAPSAVGPICGVTLTPFGFQNESRSVWEAPDVYTKVSTFFTADKIKTLVSGS